MTAAHRLRAWHLNRQADQLKRRVNAGLYRQSAHQTGTPARRDQLPDAYGSPWFALIAIAAAFAVGYVCADDQRIERDQQAQLTALCAQPWPDAPGAIEAKRRACRVKKQS